MCCWHTPLPPSSQIQFVLHDLETFHIQGTSWIRTAQCNNLSILQKQINKGNSRQMQKPTHLHLFWFKTEVNCPFKQGTDDIDISKSNLLLSRVVSFTTAKMRWRKLYYPSWFYLIKVYTPQVCSLRVLPQHAFKHGSSSVRDPWFEFQDSCLSDEFNMFMAGKT